jgi:hypothetical protein
LGITWPKPDAALSGCEDVEGEGASPGQHLLIIDQRTARPDAPYYNNGTAEILDGGRWRLRGVILGSPNVEYRIIVVQVEPDQVVREHEALRTLPGKRLAEVVVRRDAGAGTCD